MSQTIKTRLRRLVVRALHRLPWTCGTEVALWGLWGSDEDRNLPMILRDDCRINPRCGKPCYCGKIGGPS